MTTRPVVRLDSPFELGGRPLPHRIVMAPMTRLRADADGTPGPLTAHYYAQRASAALIVTEATAVSRQGSGYAGAPALYTNDHVRGWRAVTDAVHAAGGRICAQLFHVGRLSHPDFHEGALPVAPSAVAAGPPDASYDTVHAFVTPRALHKTELAGVVEQFARSSRLALEAGFDYVEVHAANGYLLDQFLQTGSNTRTDEYGGSAANRARLLEQVLDAVIAVTGANRVGVRVSPASAIHGMRDDDPEQTFSTVAELLSARGVAYLHVIEPEAQGPESTTAQTTSGHLGSGWFRQRFASPIISAGGHTAESGAARLSTGDADLIAYGKPYIANPDLAGRLLTGTPLAAHDPATVYGGSATGYIDYPPHRTVAAA